VRRSGSAWVLTAGRASLLVAPRGVLVAGLLAAAVAALLLAGLAVGTRAIALPDLLAALVGEADRATTLTVQRLRLPRSVVAVLVGAALGVAGAITQSLLRNPLASPDVLGVTSGASAGAVLVLLTAGGATVGYGGAAAGLSAVGVPLGAVAGALLCAALVLSLGSRSASQVVLVGILLNAVFLGLVQWFLTLGDVDQAVRATVWLTGSLQGRGWEHVWAVSLALALLLPVLLLARRGLDALQLGDETASVLGVRVRRTRLLLLLLAFALAGTAVAAAGPVPFVALLAPVIARRLSRGAGVPLLTAGLVGAALLLAADLLARVAVPGHELPAGAITALVGAPCLLVLLVRPGGSA
jgi:iron complex transport system permease protein